MLLSELDQYPHFGEDHDLVKALFTRESDRQRLSRYREGPIEVLPGIMSNDPTFLTFKDVLSRKATEAFPPTVDDLGRVSGNGVRSNMYGIRHVSGYPMLPATMVMSSNEYLRESAGLVNSFQSERDEKIFRAFVRLFFSNLSPRKVKVKKNSSSVAPYFTKDVALKEIQMRQALDDCLDAGALMLKGEFEECWNRFRIGGAYYTVYRQQASDVIDLVGAEFVAKERKVSDLLHALSGGRKGRNYPANKNFGNEVDFNVPNGFFRARQRSAQGGPLGTNSPLMVVATAVRERIYRDFAYSFHHTTRMSLEADFQQLKLMIAADVSSHDIYWPHFPLEVVRDELIKMGFDERYVALMYYKSKLPSYVTGVGPDVPNVLNGDWRNPSNTGGLPSGNAFTDIEGTIWMAFVYFLIMADHTYPQLLKSVRSDEDAEMVVSDFLQGKLPIKMKNKSDDAILGWSDPALVPSALELQSKMERGEQVSPYMIVSYEHGGAFLGNVLLYDSARNPATLKLIGNANSMIVNEFSPEYGVYNGHGNRAAAKRPYGGLAWLTMHENYGTCPVYHAMRELVERVWSDTFGFSYSLFRKEWAEKDQMDLARNVREQSNITSLDLTAIDVEVLMDPSRAEWKYSDHDVSASVRDLLFRGITAEEIEPLFKQIVP